MPWLQNHALKGLLILGSTMNLDVIRQRMEDLVTRYTTDLAEQPPRGMKAKDYAEWMDRRRKLETTFYAAMQHFESLLYDPQPQPRPTPTPPTPTPPTPTPKRGRGRPFTGGRKPRDRRVHKDDDSYSE